MPNVAVGFMIEHLLHLEIDGGVGLDMDSAWMPYQEFNFFIALACQVCCCLLWALLGMYFDKIMPREFGRAEPWDFLCKKKSKKVDMTTIGEEQHDEKLVKQGNFEMDPPHLKKLDALKIRGLKKEYSNGTVAVKNESMTMYRGQIFALLGHNGAGKTTTIGMLTGLLDPTAGSATFDGYEIFNDMNRLREDLGVCPQHNVLFAELTVREHLEIFCTLKGQKSIFEINRRVDKMISQLEIEDV